MLAAEREEGIAQGRREERERCAWIAEDFDKGLKKFGNAGRFIAERIRSQQ